MHAQMHTHLHAAKDALVLLYLLCPF
uniref:Uncharacterized protein n=1 Tax=Anguilla anguilla TaxID=7936 RepID=A0A0E9TBI7_ANGAN